MTRPTRTWHDPRDRRLARAARKLKRLNDANASSTQTTRTLWILALLAGIAVMSIIGLQTQIISNTESIVLGLCCIIAAICRMQFWPSVAKWRFNRHLRRLRSGKYGPAFIVDYDCEWSLMDTALRAHSMSLSQALNAEHARPHLAQYLVSTFEARVTLRQPQLEAGRGGPLLEHIQWHAKEAAARIASQPLTAMRDDA